MTDKPGESTELATLAEQGKHVAQNMTEVFDISSQIWQKFMAGQMEAGKAGHPDPLNTWPTFAELFRTMWDHPQQVADMTIEYWAAQQQLWQQSMLKWLGAKDMADAPALPHMAKPDKRFAHKEWSENASSTTSSSPTC
jgi:polyhydroxyalkanoate synthase